MIYKTWKLLQISIYLLFHLDQGHWCVDLNNLLLWNYWSDVFFLACTFGNAYKVFSQFRNLDFCIFEILHLPLLFDVLYRENCYRYQYSSCISLIGSHIWTELVEFSSIESATHFYKGHRTFNSRIWQPPKFNLVLILDKTCRDTGTTVPVFPCYDKSQCLLFKNICSVLSFIYNDFPIQGLLCFSHLKMSLKQMKHLPAKQTHVTCLKMMGRNWYSCKTQRMCFFSTCP